ncbi:P-loop containing nucleoside triphosphate hydrolase protein [Cantharellus anzutake]|uniref:P-loop containing nucleoside triphosphate hydrolase protein n=1 Tax=Cantharellus anzutake TaxID=1750568 RepID=UPI0019037720|nr:P-loop containing nucleoside triphosphate hydrolase protein [Cantharellus anzutake]KAF8318068.1 P-loop containing nucleoside triphosphate hydrolase protein [Cantharellus anzutake]
MPPCKVTDAGELIYPPLPIGSSPQFMQDQKFAVYMEFKQNIQSFTSALRVKAGVSALVLHGSKSPSERLGIIDQWQCGTIINGLLACVLIFTSMLKAGVNLLAADWLILLNSQWSQQDIDQIIGRVHCQPQARPVTVYHLCMVNSADSFMMYTSRSKELQLRIFTDQDKLNRLQDLLLAGHSSLHDMGEEGDAPESTADDSGGSGASKCKAATSPPNAAPAVSWRVPHGSRMLATSEEIETDVEITTDEPREPLVMASGGIMDIDSDGSQDGSTTRIPDAGPSTGDIMMMDGEHHHQVLPAP